MPPRQVRSLIDTRQYALDRTGRLPTYAERQNAFLEGHGWEEYAAWHLGLTVGATDETKARTRSSTATSAACTAPA